MKKNLKKTDFKLIATKVFLLCLFLAFGSSKAFSQCNYITTENGKENKLNIPCDFPIKVSTENDVNDQSNFDKKLTMWYSENPQLKNLDFAREAYYDNRVIEIPINYDNQLTIDEKKLVNSLPYFYEITKS